MTPKSFLGATLLACLAVSSANAFEHFSGYLPLTPEQQAAADAEMVKVTRVLPNRLALQRVAAEQKALGKLVARAATVAPAEDGAEIGGYKGGTAPALSKELNLGNPLMAYPRAVDNSAEPWFPPIGAQQGAGSCAVFSTVYYTMTSQVARLRGWNVKTDNNPAHIFSPKFIYNLVNGGGDNGTHPITCFQYVVAIGSATYADFPYDAMDILSWPTTAPIWREALNYRMAEFGELRGIDTEVGLANAKQMLADGYVFSFPGAFTSYNYASFSNDPATTMDDGLFAAGLPDSRRQVISYCNAGDVNHAMTIVGYNDDLWCDINNNGVVDSGEKGALRMANSYGTGRGDRGFAWFSYDSLKTVSAVPGGYSGPRQPAVAYSVLYWARARASYTPSLVAEITVTHPKRDQMILDVGRGPSSDPTPARMGRLSGLANKGGSWSFNGTTTPVASTFVLDCTDLMSSGTGNRWFATLEDNISVGSGDITSVRFVDRNGGVTLVNTTNPSGGLPKSVDNTTVHAYADIDPTLTLVTAAAATPNLAVGITSATLSVLGTDDGGEAALTYTWATVGTPPGAVSFSANGTNAAKVSRVTFTQPGVYEFQCAIRDSGGRTIYSSVMVTRSLGNTLEGPTGFTWCANEGDSSALPGLCDVAYGGGTEFIYHFNISGTVTFSNVAFSGDPAEGVAKGGFYRVRTPSFVPVGPPGYTWCGGEGSSYTLPGLSDVAYGAAPSRFSFAMNRTGTITFDAAIFIDPAQGVVKSGFYKLKSVNFANWSLTHGLSGGVNGDSDKDGIQNGIEYALQTNPQAADGSIATYRGNVVSFTKRLGVTSSHGVSYRIEVSKDLGVTDPWVAVTPSFNNETKIEAVMPQSPQKIFARLRVVLAGATGP